MKNTNPVVSLSSLILTILMLGWLGIDLWMEGGLAFNPGLLTARSSTSKQEINGFRSHAEFEKECKRCHQPFVTDQAGLCLDCHINIAEEIPTSTSVHSNLPKDSSCRLCHPDHRGREFSPLAAAAKFYDHENTGFALIKHQIGYDTAPMECGDCHKNIAEGDYQVTQDACITCHQDHDSEFMQLHLAGYGKLTCIECHNGLDQMADFKHENSQFPLTGQHANLDCTKCHIGTDSLPRFTGILHACANCHTEPNLHKGLFENLCENCHTTEGWKPVILDGQVFDHSIQGRFSLQLHINQPNADLKCNDCHSANLKDPTETACLDCHSKDKPEFTAGHSQQFGTSCNNCHDGVDRYSNFDHSHYFALDGRHLDLECADCHGNDPLTAKYQGLGKECINCHAEPDIHAGSFGVACQDCHTTSAWSPAALRMHNFPLDHGEQGQVDCKICHTVRYTEYTCYTCHEHNQQKLNEEHSEENIDPVEFQNCTKCHPTGRKEE